jgi:hypothetical protein
VAFDGDTYFVAGPIAHGSTTPRRRKKKRKKMQIRWNFGSCRPFVDDFFHPKFDRYSFADDETAADGTAARKRFQP